MEQNNAQLLSDLAVIKKNLHYIYEKYAALQAKCDRYEKALRDNYAADFIDYLRNERNSITKEMLSDEWWLNIPASKRVVFENVLIAYDQMVDRLSKVGVAIANEALNGEGEPWWQELAIENMPQYVKITGVGCSIIQDSIVKVEGAGVFDDPMFDNMGEPYVLLRDKHFEDRGLTRMNCKNCVPATAAEYEACLQTLNVK